MAVTSELSEMSAREHQEESGNTQNHGDLKNDLHQAAQLDSPVLQALPRQFHLQLSDFSPHQLHFLWQIPKEKDTMKNLSHTHMYIYIYIGVI